MSLKLLLFSLITLLLAGPAQAAIVCSVTADAMSFGTYDHQSLTPTDSVSTIEVTCGQDTGLLGSDTTQNYNLQLSTGDAGSYSPRQMTSGANTLNYNIYTDATYSVVWGDDTGGSSSRNGSVIVPGCLLLICPDNTSLELAVGRIPAQQTVPAGSYSDQITVTVVY